MPNTDHLLYDIRLIRRNLRDKKMSEEDLKTHLESLEDLSGKFDVIEIADDPEPDDEDDEDLQVQS